MRRSLASLRNSLAAGAALLLSGLATPPAQAAPVAPMATDGTPMALLLRVNEGEAGEPIRVLARGDQLWADADALRAAGVVVPAQRSGLVDLASLPDTEYTLNRATQTLSLRQRRSSQLSLSPAASPQPLSPGRAAFALSYDLTAIVGPDDHLALAGYVEGRAFAGGVALASGAVLAPRRNGGSRAIRLDSALTITDPDRLFRATVGDVVGTGLRWSRSVRVAGIQMGSDFALRPDLVTYPLPAIAGDVAVPSTIDVIAEGGRTIAQAKVQPGDYLLSGIPVPTGHGTVGIVVRDASGRQSLRTIALYGAPQLLAPGLMEIGGDMGAVRRGYGRRSADYRGFAASVTARRGITPFLTLEGHGEATETLRLGGVGAIVGLGDLGVLSADAALSQIAGSQGAGSQGAADIGTQAPASGHQLGIGFERVARPLSFSITARHVSRGYRDTASVNGDAPPRSTLAGQMGLDLGAFGSASIGYTRLAATGIGPVPLDALSLLTASYSVQVRDRVTLFAAGLGDFGHSRTHGQAHSLSMGLSMALGGARVLTGGYDLRAGADSVLTEYRDPALATGQLGYRVAAAGGAAARLLAEIEYRAAPARLVAALDRIGGRVSARFGARGALLIVDDGIFLADSLAGGFAIVSAGAPDVTVLQDHRPIGRTRADGRYLVTNLRLYQDNLIAIDPLDLPANARAGDTRLTVRPGERGPVRADFAVDQSTSATVQLVDGAGMPVEVGAEARLNDRAPVPVGYNGLIWLDGLTADNALVVTRAGGAACGVHIVLGPDERAALALSQRIGPLRCLPL